MQIVSLSAWNLKAYFSEKLRKEILIFSKSPAAIFTQHANC